MPNHFVALSLALATGCVGTIDTTDNDILGGTPTSGYPAVGMVGVSTAAELCTGYLISPTIVLTAAHCISTPNAAYGFYTGLGRLTTVTDVTPQTLDTLPNVVKHAVVESRAYPGADLTSSPYRNDVAYVRLAEPISIPPLELGPLPAVGASCTAVGYGMVSTSSPTGLLKKEAIAPVAAVDAFDIDTRYGTGTAHRGDSGGPLLCGGKAVGVFSWIDDFEDATALRRYARIDGAVGAWIESIVHPPLPGAYRAGDPFDYALVTQRSQMVATMLAELRYASSVAPRAIAINADGLGYVSVQPGATSADAQRTALQACYVMGGRKPCALLAREAVFAVDARALATSFTSTLAKPQALTDLPFASAATRGAPLAAYTARANPKAIAVGLDGTTTFVPKDATDVIGSQAEAERLALERCEMTAISSPCTLFARANAVVLDPAAMRWSPVIDYARTTVGPDVPGMTASNYAAHMVPYLSGLASGYRGVTYIAENGQGGNAWQLSLEDAEAQALGFCNQFVGAIGTCFRYAIDAQIVMSPNQLDAIRHHSVALHCAAMPRLDCATHARMGCRTSGAYYTTRGGGVALEACAF